MKNHIAELADSITLPGPDPIPLESFIHKHPYRWPSCALRWECWETNHQTPERAAQELYALSHSYPPSYHLQLLRTCPCPTCVNPHHHVMITSRWGLHQELEQNITVEPSPSKCWIWTGRATKPGKRKPPRPYLNYQNHHLSALPALLAQMNNLPAPTTTTNKHTCNDPMCVNPDHFSLTNIT